MWVHDSQAYRKMDVTRERTSRIWELREILLLFQTGFSVVNAAVVCAILESISGLEPSSLITEPRYLVLDACDCLQLLSIHFDLCVDATGVVKEPSKRTKFTQYKQGEQQSLPNSRQTC